MLGQLGERPRRDEVIRAILTLRGHLREVEPLARAAAQYEAIDQLKRLGVAAEESRSLVRAGLGGEDEDRGGAKIDPSGRVIAFEDPEPWPELVKGTKLFDELVSTLRRYIAMGLHDGVAIALWIVHSWCLEVADITPRLGITSPRPRCGKSRLLSLIGALVPRPLITSNLSAAALFRSIELHAPTLLADEFDNANSNLPEKSDLRAVLNAGWSREGGEVLRCTGEHLVPTAFSVWAPAAFALIGRLPETLEDRSILILMRRRKKEEVVARLRMGRLRRDLLSLRQQLARWAKDNLDALRDIDPVVPEGLDDRAADNWRPLLALADQAAGEWPARARVAAVALSVGRDKADDSAGVMLLADLRDQFEATGTDRLTSKDFLETQRQKEERPWAEWNRGKPISYTGAAKLLKPFEIAPRTIRLESGETPKGYLRESCEEAFSRYLPPLGPPQRHNT